MHSNNKSIRKRPRSMVRNLFSSFLSPVSTLERHPDESYELNHAAGDIDPCHQRVAQDCYVPRQTQRMSTLFQARSRIHRNLTALSLTKKNKSSSSLFSRRTGYGTMESIVRKEDMNIIEQDEGDRVPLELEVRKGRKNPYGVRKYAIAMSAVLAIGFVILSFTNNNNARDIAATPKKAFSNLDNNSKQSQNEVYRLAKVQQPKRLEEEPLHESTLRKLKEEFHEWMEHHKRDYGSEEEKEKRFHIWKENHFRTLEKNEKHGPCKLTGKAVFGKNHLSDLTAEEFQSKFLTGYKGPHTNEMPSNHRRRLRSDQLHEEPQDILKTSSRTKRRVSPIDILTSDGLQDPSVLSEKVKRHDSVQERYLKYVEQAPMLDKTYYNREERQNERKCKCGSSSTNSNTNSNNYNNYYNSYGNRRARRLEKRQKSPLFGKTYYNKQEKQYICGYTKTYYNKKQSLDCSKYKLEAGQDYETSDSYEYSMNRCAWYDVSCWLRGVFQPIYSSSSERHYSNYNYPSSMDWRKMGAVTSIHSQSSCGACWAITATETIESAYYISTGKLYDLSEQEIIICDDTCDMCNGGWPQNAYEYVMNRGGLPKESSYDSDLLMTMTMVKNGESDELTENEMESIVQQTCPADESGSQKNDNSSSERFAVITGYAYATDRCVCYTDGTGCDCDEQNEVLAVMNVATYGPATVCLEASTWQDYTGGIITADSGCSSGFMDMNHCVQAVGYAFQEVSADGDGEEEEGSGSKSGDGEKTLEGYWIIRNQWTQYWGMNGYAYVAMGSNTCGVLNDMTQVFM